MARCGQKTEVWSRVCGYYRPVRKWDGGSSWNIGKQAEYADRTPYDVSGGRPAEPWVPKTPEELRAVDEELSRREAAERVA